MLLSIGLHCAFAPDSTINSSRIVVALEYKGFSEIDQQLISMSAYLNCTGDKLSNEDKKNTPYCTSDHSDIQKCIATKAETFTNIVTNVSAENHDVSSVISDSSNCEDFKGDCATIMIYVDGKSWCSDVTFSTFLVDLSALAISHESIELKWTKPLQCSEHILQYAIVCKNSINQEQFQTPITLSKKAYILKDLMPDVEYKVIVKAVSAHGILIQASEEIMVKTECHPELVAPGSPVPIEVTHNCVRLQWAAPQHKSSIKISSYQISFSEENSSSSTWKLCHSGIKKENTEIANLKPKTAYVFKVRADYENGILGQYSENSCIITTKGLISDRPGRPKKEEITSNCIRVSFKEPKVNAGSILNYTVWYCVDKDDEEEEDDWKKVHSYDRETSAVITCLQPDTEYKIKIVAECEGGPSDESEPRTFRTLTPTSGPPGTPYLVECTHSTIIVQWSKPAMHEEFVAKYLVHFTLEGYVNWNNQRWTNGTENRIQIEGLTPNTSYIFKVKAECKNGSFSDYSRNSSPIKTNDLIISPPSEIHVIEKAYNYIKIGWKEPKDHVSLIEKYRMTYYPVNQRSNCKSINAHNGETSITVQQLLPETKYCFKIEVVTYTGQISKKSVETTVSTDKAVSSYPRNLKILGNDHNSVSLCWDKPLTNPGLVDCYIIAYHFIDEPEKFMRNYQKEIKETEVTVVGLPVNKEVVFYVQAISKHNKISDLSARSEVVKLSIPIPGRPGKPSSIDVAPDSITLKWMEPEKYSQFIISYRVWYQVHASLEWKLLIFPREKQSVCIPGLIPKTTYKFKVEAESKSGIGEASEESDCIKTAPGLPSKPGKPISIRITHNEITITWATPKKFSENILNYIVSFAIYDSDPNIWMTTKCEGQNVVCTISELDPNTKYVFRVVAENEDGIGDESDVSDVISTQCPLPSRPGKPECIEKAHDFIILRWQKPEQHAGNVQFYEVMYTDTEGVASNNQQRKIQQTEGAVEQTRIHQLNPQQGYYFKVRAYSAYGYSEDSLLSDRIGTESQRLAIKVIPSCKKQPDNPRIYMLQMKEVINDHDNIAKFEYGKISPLSPQKMKVLLVVGATGAGKSTLINGMVNFLFDVQWTDDFRLKLIVENVQSQSESVTKCITSYAFHHQDGFRFPYSLTIIDTPGFGDTGGIKRDKVITSQIKKFFENRKQYGIDHLDAIGFVTNSSLARLTKTQEYIFDSVLSIFGNNLKNNIFLLTTFADGGKPPVLDAIKVAKIPYKDSFKFNNSALYSDSSDQLSKMFWDIGISSFADFFAKFESTSSISLHLSEEVLQTREQLETTLSGLQKQIQTGMIKIGSLKQLQDVLKKHKKDIEDNKNFTYTTTETKIVEVKLGSGEHVTNCLKCNFTCHYPCYIRDSEEKYNCAAMNSHDASTASCKACPGKCSWRQHKNYTHRLELQSVPVNGTYENLKAAFKTACEGKTKYESMLIAMEKEIQELFYRILDIINEARLCSARLEEIALRQYPLNNVEYIDLLIESENLDKKPGFSDRIMYYKEVRKKAELISKFKGTDEQLKLEPEWWRRFLSIENEEGLPIDILPKGVTFASLSQRAPRHPK